MYPQPILEIQSLFWGLRLGSRECWFWFPQKASPYFLQCSLMPCRGSSTIPWCLLTSQLFCDNQIYMPPAWAQILPLTQLGHRRWARLIWPQPGHLLRLFTSLRAFPAICRWRFFMWEVFFLGTARRTESQRSERSDGILREIETGCRNPLVAMGVIGRNRASRGNWRDSESSERDMVAGAKGRRRNAMLSMDSSTKKGGLVLWSVVGAITRDQRVSEAKVNGSFLERR